MQGLLALNPFYPLLDPPISYRIDLNTDMSCFGNTTRFLEEEKKIVGRFYLKNIVLIITVSLIYQFPNIKK